MFKRALILCGGAIALLLPLWAQAQSPSAAPDSSVCASCHQQAVDSMASSRHGVKGDPRTPFGSGKDCLACHGNASAHLQDPTKAKPTILFGKSEAATEMNAPCESCHKGGTRIHWKGSAHDRNDVACVACHKVHAAKDQVLVAQTQAGVCFDCHKNVRAETMKIASHPLKSGWMPCSSCHNPHGSVGPAQVTKQSINQTCYTCHADKRGPYLWQHTPVQENCANCHTPHGSNVNGLLVARTPMLCQQCHESGSHRGAVYSGANLPKGPGQTGTGSTSTVVGKNCLECHGRIHGSNNPNGRTLRQ